MAKTIKQAKADIYLRDTDSQSLFNNSGVLVFKYFHEWNDCYNQKTGETAQIDGETYDEETGAYKPNCPAGFSPVFNGRLSALWDNMASCFPDKVQEMYKTMRNNGLSYKDMMGKYKDFWSYWCENLYNADAFGYANTGHFTKAYGDKVQLMDFFFQKRERYLDSKYCCGSSVSNNLRLRLNEVGKGLAIKYYQAIYSSLQWGANNFSTQRNIEAGTYSYMPFNLSSPQDATFDIDDADLITELSTYTKTSTGYAITGLEGLGDFKFDMNMKLLKRLTKFIMNYTAAKPNTKQENDNFSLDGLGMLRQVIVRNVKNLTASITITSDVVEEIDFTNTPIAGLTTPPSDSLTKLVLPDTIQSLTLIGYTNLKPSGLQIAGYSNVDVFEVEDCPNIDTLDLLSKCKEAGAPLTQVTLKDVDWSLESLDLLLYLAEKKATLTGRIAIADSVNVSLAQKMQLISAFGDIDDTSNSLYISYKIVEIKSIAIKGKSYLEKKGSYTYVATTTPSNGNNAKEFAWSISENSFATKISDDGVLEVTSVGSKENDDKGTINLSVSLSDGTVLEANPKTVYFYKYECQLGDYLFADGTYGPSLSGIDSTPVGVVFYLEPKYRRYALAVSCEAIEANSYWGIDSQYFPGIKLNEYTGSVYNISSIEDFTSGKDATDDNMIDEGNTDNDGFKSYDKLTSLGDIGFEQVTSKMYNEQGLGDYLDKMGLAVGDMISAGQLKTIRIIKHRDSILSDSAVNLPIPKATESKTEYECLEAYMEEVRVNHYNNWSYQQYYYPAASRCYAFKPTTRASEELADSVKPNRWFLPSIGEMERISFYVQHGFAGADKYAIFTNAKEDGKLAQIKDNWHWCSSELAERDAWICYPQSGRAGGSGSGGKSNSSVVRPVVAFRLQA